MCYRGEGRAALTLPTLGGTVRVEKRVEEVLREHRRALPRPISNLDKLTQRWTRRTENVARGGRFELELEVPAYTLDFIPAADQKLELISQRTERSGRVKTRLVLEFRLPAENAGKRIAAKGLLRVDRRKYVTYYDLNSSPK